MNAQLNMKKEMLKVHEQRLISIDERISLQTQRGNIERVEFLNERKSNVIALIETLKKEIEVLEAEQVKDTDVVLEEDVIEDVVENEPEEE